MYPAAALLLRRSPAIGVRLACHCRVHPSGPPLLPRANAVRRLWAYGSKKTPPPEPAPAPAPAQAEEEDRPMAEPVSLIHDFDFSIKPSDGYPEPPPSPADSDPPPPEPAPQTPPPPPERETAFGDAEPPVRQTPARFESKTLRSCELPSLLDQVLRSVGCSFPIEPPPSPANGSGSSRDLLARALSARLRSTGTAQPAHQMAASAVRAAELWYPTHSSELREYVATVLALQDDIERALASDPCRVPALRRDLHHIARSGGCSGSSAIEDLSLRALARWIADTTPRHFGPYATGAIHRSFMGYVLGLMADELPPLPVSVSVPSTTVAPAAPAAPERGREADCKYPLRFLISTRKAGGNYELLVHSLFPESQFPEATELPRFRPIVDEAVTLTSKLADILAFYRRAIVDRRGAAKNGAAATAPDPLVLASRRVETLTAAGVLRRLVRQQCFMTKEFKVSLLKPSFGNRHAAELCLRFLEGFVRWHCLEEERFRLQAVLGRIEGSAEGLDALD